MLHIVYNSSKTLNPHKKFYEEINDTKDEGKIFNLLPKVKISLQFYTVLITISSINATNTTAICAWHWQAGGPAARQGKLSCPGGKINIISAVFGREQDDPETCCDNSKNPTIASCVAPSGELCVVDALPYVQSVCSGQGKYRWVVSNLLRFLRYVT